MPNSAVYQGYNVKKTEAVPILTNINSLEWGDSFLNIDNGVDKCYKRGSKRYRKGACIPALDQKGFTEDVMCMMG